MSESIGQIIKEHRKKCHFTQEELAKHLNVTAQAISKWENDVGFPDVSQIVPLAKALDISTDILLGKDKKPSDAGCYRSMLFKEELEDVDLLDAVEILEVKLPKFVKEGDRLIKYPTWIEFQCYREDFPELLQKAMKEQIYIEICYYEKRSCWHLYVCKDGIFKFLTGDEEGFRAAYHELCKRGLASPLDEEIL